NTPGLAADVIAMQPEAVQRLLSADRRPSLAVLPFANRSGLEEDSYFTDGMHEEILTRISRIKGLRTIPRTSVEGYRDARASILEIGADLAVAYLLQGSVQRAADQVRISVQLVDANTEDHLWSDEYTERATPQDLFEIQSRVTDEVARELRLVVVEEEERRFLQGATHSQEAYDWYLKALSRWQIPAASGLVTPAVVEEQMALLGRALEADPEFGQAHAHAAVVHINAHYWSADRSPERAERARAALERADRFAPDDPSVRWIRAEYLYSVERDAGGALEILTPLEDVLGQDEAYQLWKGVLERTRGDWAASITSFEAGTRLNPRSTHLWEKLGTSRSFQRQFGGAEEAYRTAIELSPGNSLAEYFLGWIPLQRDGDIRNFRAWVAETGVVASYHLQIQGAYLDRDWEALTALLDRAASDLVEENPLVIEVRPLWQARVAWATGDRESARVRAQAAVEFLQRYIDARGEDRRFLRALSLAHALLGEVEAADQAMARALELLPLDSDALEAAWVRADIATMQVYLERHDEALTALDELLYEPGFITVPMVTLDATYDSLRQDPRFQSLLDRHREF
ncbi:MAG: hypothetical protein ACR2RD_11855, partial [Woeseiaceae bacterium]